MRDSITYFYKVSVKHTPSGLKPFALQGLRESNGISTEMKMLLLVLLCSVLCPSFLSRLSRLVLLYIYLNMFLVRKQHQTQPKPNQDNRPVKNTIAILPRQAACMEETFNGDETRSCHARYLRARVSKRNGNSSSIYLKKRRSLALTNVSHVPCSFFSRFTPFALWPRPAASKRLLTLRASSCAFLL